MNRYQFEYNNVFLSYEVEDGEVVGVEDGRGNCHTHNQSIMDAALDDYERYVIPELFEGTREQLKNLTIK